MAAKRKLTDSDLEHNLLSVSLDDISNYYLESGGEIDKLEFDYFDSDSENCEGKLDDQV